MLTVAVNGNPLGTVAIVRRGRVLLPMRSTFAQLGASVSYDPAGRVVVARSAQHDVRLPIGSTSALVDGVTTALDVPAQIIASTTFVPLRFVAQAFGAQVGYDASAGLVTIATSAALSASAAAKIALLAPVPGAQVATAYPDITASIQNGSAVQSDVELTVDGQNVTPLASFDGTTITYLPRSPLALGPHTVAFSGKTLRGIAFSSQWTFTTTSTPQADQDVPLQTYGYQFFSSGPAWFHYGDWMHFTLVAPPGGSAYLQLCGLGYQYAFWNGGTGGNYIADIPAPLGYWISSCPVTAVYTAWNGRQYFIPYPVYIGLYTAPQPYVAASPTPNPAATPRPVTVPPGHRRAEPTPMPAPKPRPLPKPVVRPPIPRAVPTRAP